MVRALTRVATPACEHPGCCNTRHVDGHHIRHWAHGGETRPDNLVLLCRRHHMLVHEGGCVIRKHYHEDGALDFEFVAPDGGSIPVAEDLRGGSWERRVADVAAETPGLNAAMHVPDMDWRPPDYDHTAWWMVNFMAR